MASKPIQANDEATQRMLTAFSDATSTTTSVIKQVQDMQSQIPSFWQGDAAATFTNSVTTWLDGASKINVGLQDLQETMNNVQNTTRVTEGDNTQVASVPTNLSY